MILSSIKGLICRHGKINIAVKHWIFTRYMITVQMIISITEISAIVKLACPLIPPYESTVYVFHNKIIRRLSELFRKLHTAAVTLPDFGRQFDQFIPIR